MDQLNIVQRRNFSEINYMDLTYHYAFQAKMLDITSDRQTALFFAFCKDGNDHMWHPLTQNAFVYKSLDYISIRCNDALSPGTHW